MKVSNATSSRKARPDGLPGNGDSSSSTADPRAAERFTLSGPSAPLDERVHAYRRDIADIALAGQVIAPQYARPAMRSAARKTAVRAEPSEVAERVTELGPGEEFAVLDMSGAWAWGYCRTDHRVGYIRLEDLAV